MPDFKLERNTLSRSVKDYAPDRIELEIGDSKQDDFIPQAKIMRWDNEVNFSIRRDNGARSFKERGGKVIAESDKEDVVIYEKPDIAEDGGLEVEIHLKEKPDTNIFTFTLETKGLDFFYQPPLTQEEIDDGDERPDNVVGSYAVYHSTKKHNLVGGKEYKSGKAFHIYRPHVTDADNNETWAELQIEGSELRVVVPQEFLDSAVYPVVVDPTFGYTTIGASTDAVPYDLLATPHSISENGTVESVSTYFSLGGTSPVMEYAGLIYDSSRALVSESTYIQKNTTGGEWLTTSVDNITLTNGATYFIASINNVISGSSVSPTMYYDTGAINSEEDGNNMTWSAFPDPYTVDFTRNSRTYSIYATYTALNTNTRINIGDSWKSVDAMKINIGDSWKDVVAVKINIGDTWKDVF